jgi:hypothetical protein
MRVPAEPPAWVQTPKPSAEKKLRFPAQLCRREAQPGQLEREETARELQSQAQLLPDISPIQQAVQGVQAAAWETPRQAAAAPQCLPAEKPVGGGRPGAQGDGWETWALELEWASA